MYYSKTKRLTKKAERWFSDARTICIEEKQNQNWLDDLKSVWYYVDMDYYFNDRRIRDSHNCIKILMDAMQGILFHNDYYCMPRINSVNYTEQSSYVIVTIYPQLLSKT